MSKAKLDKVFSEYIRLRNADWKGWSHCYTCGEPAFWKYLECGHYNKRAHMSTRMNEINSQSQCVKCNHNLNGNLEVFRANLIRDYGLKAIEELESIKFETKKYFRHEIDELIKHYQREVERLKKNL